MNKLPDYNLDDEVVNWEDDLSTDPELMGAAQAEFPGGRVPWVKWSKGITVIRFVRRPFFALKHKVKDFQGHRWCLHWQANTQGLFYETKTPCAICDADDEWRMAHGYKLFPDKVILDCVLVRSGGGFPVDTQYPLAARAEFPVSATIGIADLLRDPEWGDVRKYNLKIFLPEGSKRYSVVPSPPTPLRKSELELVEAADFNPRLFVEQAVANYEPPLN